MPGRRADIQGSLRTAEPSPARRQGTYPFHSCKRKGRLDGRPYIKPGSLRREEFCGVSRSASDVYEKYMSEGATNSRRKRTAPRYRGCGSGEIIGPGPAGRGLPAAGTEVPSLRVGTGSS